MFHQIFILTNPIFYPVTPPQTPESPSSPPFLPFSSTLIQFSTLP